MERFHESHPAFSGFSQFYNREIYPQLAAWESRRKWKSFWAVPMLILSSIICACFFYWSVTVESKFLSYFGIFFVIFSSPVLVYRVFFRALKADVKDFLVGKVCNYTGLQYSRKPNTSAPLQLFRQLKFLPFTYRFRRYEDHILGSCQGIPFQVFEAHGETGNSRFPKPHISTIFKFDLPPATQGDFVVLRRSDPKPAKKLGLKPIGFAAPPFSHLFEVYGTDQVLSRFLLHPVFLERILYGERLIGGANTRFALSGQTLWVCVETFNRFEEGSMWTSFINPKRTQQLVWEISSALHVVDGLAGLLREPGRAA